MNASKLYQKQATEVYPIRAAMVTAGGIILVRGSQRQKVKLEHQEKRGRINQLSTRSLAKLALTAQATIGLFHSMLTLTYGPNFPNDGEIVKGHLKRILAWLQKRGVKNYLWFIEFQKRGAPHIHLILDCRAMDIGIYQREIALYWSQMVEPEGWEYISVEFGRNGYRRKGSTLTTTRKAVEMRHRQPEHWEMLRSKDGAARYVTKYATKPEQKKIPDGYQNMGRFWGAPQHLSLKKLIKTWVYTDEDGAIEMAKLMKREDLANWEYLPKIILGNTDEICKILEREV